MELFLAPMPGIWSRSVSGWEAFLTALAAGSEARESVAEPVAALLPEREGRRAPLLVRLALETGVQACRENGMPLGEVVSVFASAMGDLDITDYMCRTLAGPQPMMSPTRFHNSVHNAASGYWSIGAMNRQPSTAVAADRFTFPMALLESATLAICERRTVLLIAADVPAPVLLSAISTNRQPFAASLLVSASAPASGWRSLRLEWCAGSAAWPVPRVAWLERLAEENTSARCLALLECLASPEPFSLMLPAGSSAALRIEVGAGA